MKKYVIFTKINGIVYYICHTEAKGEFVAADAPDCDIMKFDDEEAAQKIADRNSDDEIKYEVKGIDL